MIMYDPLDRPIPPEPEEDQTTKSTDLLQILQKMEGIVGENLENPLDYKKNAIFTSLQIKAKNEIVDLANRKMQEAKQAGD